MDNKQNMQKKETIMKENIDKMNIRDYIRAMESLHSQLYDQYIQESKSPLSNMYGYASINPNYLKAFCNIINMFCYQLHMNIKLHKKIKRLENRIGELEKRVEGTEDLSMYTFENSIKEDDETEDDPQRSMRFDPTWYSKASQKFKNDNLEEDADNTSEEKRKYNIYINLLHIMDIINDSHISQKKKDIIEAKMAAIYKEL